MELEFSLRIFQKFSNIKFHENLSIGRRVVPYWQMGRRTDTTKLVVGFCNWTRL